jgi:DNA excision repair protein ERCC-2
MNFDLEQRTANLSVGEFADFAIGPREGGDGPTGLWRAQLGTYWHRELQTQATADNPAARFEVPIVGAVFHRGWTLSLNGRIDQLVPAPDGGQILREIKTVMRPIPAPEEELRADYPSYFAQLATYLSLRRIEAPETSVRGELVFVEAGSGLAQTIPVTRADEALFTTRLERVVEFLELRWRARERLRGLVFRSPFPQLRPGQETTQAELDAALRAHRIIAFEAPTGFGKTGMLLETALEQLRAGRFERLVYLTGKSTGQLQVQLTLAGMTAPEVRPADAPDAPGKPAGYSAPAQVAVWQIRNKGEHCINHTFHCVRDQCRFLADIEARWPGSGLSRFYLLENGARDLATLRAAGRDAGICPYEITRAALAFQDVWIGDYNYVFAPRNRGLFENQPGWVPAQTLLVIDEAHNLPSRVADTYSHSFDAASASAIASELHQVRALGSLVTAWDHWTHFLQQLRPIEALDAAAEDDARHLLEQIGKHVLQTSLDPVALGPNVMDALWRIPALADELTNDSLPRLWWCARAGELEITCLDAAAAIGGTLRHFGGIVLASATLSPIDAFAAACGLAEPPPPTPVPTAARVIPERLGSLTKRATKQLYRQVSSGAELLRVEEQRAAESLHLVTAHTPWREGAYDVAYDVRVDTSYQQRDRHRSTTARTIAALGHTAGGCVAVFLPSYAYADAIARELAQLEIPCRVALQPRLPDLAAQTAWVEQSLTHSDALFLVLGSSFAEGIDLLGGRVSHAMVVGPALPEVNASQRARLAGLMQAGASRDAAVRRVYRIPGLQKINQALGRLVRAPGQQAKVLLHCRRFTEPAFATLLAQDYQNGTTIATDEELADWLRR